MLWKRQQKFHCITVIKSLFSFLFLIHFCFLNAQIDQKKAPLIEVLEHLEAKFPYRFNYSLKTIEDIIVTYPPVNISFQQVISYLEKQTALKFTMLRNSFVSITTDKAYVLCGFIKDIESKKPIVAATIQGLHSSVISDENGYFEIEVTQENENIRIQHLGFKIYHSTYRILKKETCTDIHLNGQPEELSQIIVTSYITEGISKLTNGTFQMNLLNFGILPGLIEADVLQTIQALPGIQSIDETVSNINIRGGSHDENLILWDGIKMYQSGHFFGLISVFNPQMTDHVSLHKNGTRADYSDGVSGTISMKTDDAINSKFKGSIGVNFISLDGFADIPLSQKSSLQVAARKGISDFYKTPTYNAYYDRILQDTELDSNIDNVINSNIEFDFYDTSLRWLYDIDDKNQIRLNLMIVDNELVFNETANFNSIQESRRSNLTQTNFAAGIYYKKIWNNDFHTELQVYETDYELEAINANILENQRLLQENKVSETGTKLNTFYEINDKLTFLNGYEFIETQVINFEDVDNPVYSLYVSEVLRTHGLYSQINFKSQNKDTNFNMGIRMNYIGRFDKFIIEPRISFNQKIHKNFNVEVLGEFKHQVTSQIINFQDDFLGVEERRWQLSNNRDIPVITSKQLSLGLLYHKNGWLVNGEAYYKKVEGITTQSQGFQNQYLFARTDGNYQVSGFDFLLKKQLKNLNTWLSYSYVDNSYTFNKLSDVTFPNNLDITHALTFGSAYHFENLKISAGFNWHSGKPTTNPVSGNEIIDNAINYETANSSRLNEYFRIDLSSTYRFSLTNNVKADIGLSVWNVLNNKNTINNHYRINDNGAIEETQKSSLKFTPNVSLRVSF
jgi:uncharacterized protein YunC (DUF1805 family)